MTENNITKNIPDNMNVVVVIDKEKLPEDVRKLLEENLPKDVQEKVLKMLGRPPPVSDNKVPGKLDNSTPDNIYNRSDNKLEDNKLFAIQTGSVVGNIYTDGIYKKEEDSYVKKKDINNSGGCC
jgi:hypothetical protein